MSFARVRIALAGAEGEAIREPYAGELPGTEAPVKLKVLSGGDDPGLNRARLTPAQRAVVEPMIAAFRGKEATA